MSHALEAYVCTARNDFSDAFAEKASQLIFQHLEAVVHLRKALELLEFFG